MDGIESLLNELEDLLDQSKALPFSNKVSVDKEEMYEIIGEIRQNMPKEFKRCTEMLQERNKIILLAQEEAEEIRQEAQEKMARLVEQHEVTKAAYEKSAEIIDAAKRDAREMRIGATEYADQILAAAEESLKKMAEQFHQESDTVSQFFEKSLDTLYENRQELRGIDH
ncbi:MAG TPA: ATPase [Firmicutes bacterium]|nr:ATPase [Bacillota bacterium]